jgi:methionyl-tRNA formyltransferase
MDSLERCKIVVFASGQVGHQIVDFLASNSSAILAKVVIDRDRDPDEFEKLHGRLKPGAVMSWQEANTREALDEFRNIAAHVALLAWWPHVLRQPLLGSLASRVVLNLHPSLLPHCRGKDPYFWSIVEQRPFGVTIHHVSEDIDAGDIAFQEEIAVDWEDTAETLYRKAEVAMLKLFKESFSRIARRDIPRIPQDLAAGSFHVRSELDPASRIDLSRQYSGRELLDLLRARTFAPHAGCRFVDGGEAYQVRLRITRDRRK